MLGAQTTRTVTRNVGNVQSSHWSPCLLSIFTNESSQPSSIRPSRRYASRSATTSTSTTSLTNDLDALNLTPRKSSISPLNSTKLPTDKNYTILSKQYLNNDINISSLSRSDVQHFLATVLPALIKHGDSKLIDKLINDMLKSNLELKATEWTVLAQATVDMLLSTQQSPKSILDASRQFLSEYESTSLSAALPKVCHVFLKGLALSSKRTYSSEAVLDFLFVDMIAKHNIVPSDATFTILMSIFDGNHQHAEVENENMDLVDTNDYTGGTATISHVLQFTKLLHEKMDRYQETSIYLWNVLLSGYAQLGQLDSIKDILNTLRFNNTLNIMSFSSVMKGLMKAKLWNDATQFYDTEIRNTKRYQFTSKPVPPSTTIKSPYLIQVDIQLFNVCLQLFAQTGDADRAEQLYKELTTQFAQTTVQPDAHTFANLISLCAKTQDTASAEKYYKTLFDYKITPTVPVLNALLKVYARSGYHSVVMELYQYLLDKGLPITDVTVATVLDSCGWSQNVRDLKRVWRNLLHELNYPLSNFHFATYIEALSRTGLWRDALELILFGFDWMSIAKSPKELLILETTLEPKVLDGMIERGSLKVATKELKKREKFKELCAFMLPPTTSWGISSSSKEALDWKDSSAAKNNSAATTTISNKTIRKPKPTLRAITTLLSFLAKYRRNKEIDFLLMVVSKTRYGEQWIRYCESFVWRKKARSGGMAIEKI